MVDSKAKATNKHATIATSQHRPVYCPYPGIHQKYLNIFPSCLLPEELQKCLAKTYGLNALALIKIENILTLPLPHYLQLELNKEVCLEPFKLK